jgi:hypothetical protein
LEVDSGEVAQGGGVALIFAAKLLLHEADESQPSGFGVVELLLHAVCFDEHWHGVWQVELFVNVDCTAEPRHSPFAERKATLQVWRRLVQAASVMIG